MLDLSWSTLIWGLVIFVLTTGGSLLILCLLLVKMPADYFCDSGARDFWVGKRSGMHLVVRIAKNLLGATLIILGGIMAIPVVPGQGLLVMLVGIMLTDFPGKRPVELWLISRAGVLGTINRLRDWFGKPPMFLESKLSTPLATNKGLD